MKLFVLPLIAFAVGITVCDAAQFPAKELLIYREPPGTYTEAFEISILVHQSSLVSTAIFPDGQHYQCKNAGILARIGYPPEHIPSGFEQEAAFKVQSVDSLIQQFPKLKGKLLSAKTRWESALALAKRLDATRQAQNPSAARETLSFTTTDGRNFDKVTLSGTSRTGISITTDSGIEHIAYERLPKDIQERFHYEPPKVMTPANPTGGALQAKSSADTLAKTDSLQKVNQLPALETSEDTPEKTTPPRKKDDYTGTHNTFSQTSTLATRRAFHVATFLPNGKVLLTGGLSAPDAIPANAELYEPASNTWTTGNLTVKRSASTATLLPNGKVLIAGGWNLVSAELYDPLTGKWTVTGSLLHPRGGHTATLLSNGKVLVMGGGNHDATRVSAELYDPDTGTWEATGSLTKARLIGCYTATLLPNGKVLVAGGQDSDKKYLASAELYDPVAGIWGLTANMTFARSGHTATLLPNGKVLVVGGQDSDKNRLASADIYNPATGTWTLTTNMAFTRSHHTATLLPDGNVLIAGGNGDGGILSSVEIYNPSTENWITTNSLITGRARHTATLLPDGRVLIAGGLGNSRPFVMASAELFIKGTDAIKNQITNEENASAEKEYVLALRYVRDLGLTEDEVEAAEWFRGAAEGGLAQAQFWLGIYYAIGRGGLTKDQAEATKWFRKAADQGNSNSQYTLGMHYITTAGDYTEAVKWFRKAAEQGNANAEYFLGECYILGRGIPEDNAKGTAWIYKAANDGSLNAMKVIKLKSSR